VRRQRLHPARREAAPLLGPRMRHRPLGRRRRTPRASSERMLRIGRAGNLGPSRHSRRKRETRPRPSDEGCFAAYLGSPRPLSLRSRHCAAKVSKLARTTRWTTEPSGCRRRYEGAAAWAAGGTRLGRRQGRAKANAWRLLGPVGRRGRFPSGGVREPDDVGRSGPPPGGRGRPQHLAGPSGPRWR
jgi:hypothetical protein